MHFVGFGEERLGGFWAAFWSVSAYAKRVLRQDDAQDDEPLQMSLLPQVLHSGRSNRGVYKCS
jgi:hypothetical protein